MIVNRRVKVHLVAICMMLVFGFYSEKLQGRSEVFLDNIGEGYTIPDESISYYRENISEAKMLEEINYHPNRNELANLNDLEQKEWTRSYIQNISRHPYMNIENIVDKPFVSRLESPPRFDPTRQYVWHRFTLKFNQPQHETKNFVLELSRYANRAFLYTKSADGEIVYRGHSGYDMIHGHENWFSPENFIPVTIDAHTNAITCYLAIYTIRNHHNWNPLLTKESTFRKRTFTNISFYMAFAGAASIILLYNFGIFIISFDRVYLYYSLSLMFYIPFFIEVSLGRLTPWSAVGFLNRGPLVASTCFWMAFMFMFTREALHLQRYRYFNRYYCGMFLLNLLWGFTTFYQKDLGYPLPYIYKINKYCILSGILSFFITTIFLIFKKERIAWIYMLATLVWIASMWLTYCAIFGFIPMNLATYNAQHVGLLIFMVVWSIAFGDKLRILNISLQNYIGKVEQLVEEKTAKITSIMKNIPLGIFTVSGSEKLIGSEYTDHLKEILEVDEVAGSSIDEVLLEKLKIDSDSKSQIMSFFDATVGQDEISFLVNHHLAPNELTLKTSTGIKSLRSDWGAVIHDDVVQSILVSLKDVTEQVELEKEANVAKRELEIIGSIINITPDRFGRFIDSAYDFLNHNRNLIKKNKENIREVVKVLFINMHTLKGSARGYYFTHMTGMIHEVEQIYAELIKNAIKWDQESLLRDLDAVESLVREYDRINKEKLGRKKNADTTEVSLSNLKIMYKILSNNELQEFIKHHAKLSKVDPNNKLLQTIHNLYYVNIVNVLEEAAKSLPSLAKDLNKEVPSVKITGEHFVIDREGSDIISNVLLHVIRNSMDHGIEEPQARQILGKSKVGTLSFILRTSDQGLEIDYSDDGAGLNIAKIRATAIRQGFISVTQESDDQKIARLILESGFSTAEQVTEVSGRGVGMDAVKTYLENAGGSLEIELQESQSTDINRLFHLKIRLPKKYMARKFFKADGN